MSKKQLKNLARDNLVAEQPSSDEDDEHEEVPEQKKVNKFAFLDEVKEDSDSDGPGKAEAEIGELSLAEQAAAAKAAKKAKKKKQKQKAKARKAENADELEESKPAVPTPKTPTPSQPRSHEILKVTWPDLNPENELKRVLGSAFRAPPPEPRRGRPARRGGVAAALARRPQYRVVQRYDEWINIDFGKSGISLAVDYEEPQPQPPLIIHYRFEHSAAYQALQELFIQTMANSQDIESLQDLSSFHIDTMLVLINRMIQMDDSHLARKTIEFALYTLESTFPIGFDFLSPYVRFDYTWTENRCLYLLLFHHIRMLNQRRCFFTALQVAKLTLSKDPSDPIGINLMIDSLALKAKEYQFLLDFYEEFKVSHKIDGLPNMRYSVAIATHYLAVEKDDDALEAVAGQLLIEAITAFPDVLNDVCKAMSIQPSKAVTCALRYDSVLLNSIPYGLDVITKIYLIHSLEDVWKRDNLMGWIESTVEEAVQTSASHLQAEVKKSRALQQKVYIGVPHAIVRHGFVYDVTPISFGMPTFNPVPPKNSRSQYPIIEYPQLHVETEDAAAPANIGPGAFVWDMLTSLVPDLQNVKHDA
uniref:Transcription factor 25 n=1 Tax=Panagrellus redivivus TaxID=6233 RepID=A0A7E4VLG5_PANRE